MTNEFGSHLYKSQKYWVRRARFEAQTTAERERVDGELRDDVRRLVIAARVVAFEDQGEEALRELDQASEAFASRVPWEDEPDA